MNILILLTFFSFIVYLYMGIYLFKLDSKSVINRLFFAVCLSTALWALTFTFMQMANDAETALLWRRLSTYGWGILYSLLLHFFLAFTKKKQILSKWWLYLLIYIPAFIFLYRYSSDAYINASIMTRTDLGWIFIEPGPLVWAYAFMAFYTFVVVFSIVLTWRWGRSSTLKRQKKQANLIVVTLMIALIAGALTDGVLPAAGIHDIPPMAVVIILIPMSGIWYAIRKYRLSAFSDEFVSDDLFRTMGEGLLMLNNEGKIKLANTSAQNILGFREKELLSEPVDFLFDNTRMSFELLKQKIQSNKDYYSFVTSLFSKNTTHVPVLLSATMMRDQWNDPLGLVCTFQDISNRVKADQNLAHERAHFEHLFNSAPVGIVLLDNNDHIINCNNEFTRLYQFTAEEVIGKPINSLIVPEHLKEEASGISNRIGDGDTVYHETIRMRKDGKLVHVAITGKPIIVDSGQIAIYGIYQDISERKLAEEELKHRLEFQENVVRISARFASALDVDEAISDSLDEIGKVSKADRAYVFLFDKGSETASNTHEWCAEGIEPQQQNLQQLPLNSMPWWMDKLYKNEIIEIADVASLPPEAEAEKALLESQNIRSLLVLGIKIAGTLTGFIGFDFVNQPMKWTDSNLATLKVTAEVIGHALERATFRQALMLERDLLQALMDNIPDTIYFKDTKSRFTRINKAQAEVLGLPSTEAAIGKTDFDFFNNEHAQIAYDDEQRLFKSGKPVIGKQEYFKTGGTWKWMSATKVPIRDENGNITGLVGVSHDMTEQKNIEHKLRVRESFLSHLNEITSTSLKAFTTPDLYQLLADHMHKLLSSDISFITMWDAANRRITPVVGSGISQASLQSFHVEPGEKTMTESVLDAEKVLVAEDVFNSPYVSPGIAEQFPSKSLLGLPLIAYGQKFGAVLIGFSKHHQFTEEEIEFGTLAANQIALIVARTKMLEQLVENEKELRKTNAEKDKLFSVIAHDLRSPFTSFLGLTDLMADEGAEVGYDEMREFALLIQQSARGLYQLLENLLEWSKMQGGYSEFKPQELNLYQIVNASINLLMAAANKKEILLSNHIPQDISVYADHKMLRSLTGNLISNAVKFTKRGGEISVHASLKPDSRVEVEVRDSGIGMSQDTIDKLFRIDVKVAREGTEGETSSGLGLILCKEFVEMHLTCPF